MSCHVITPLICHVRVRGHSDLVESAIAVMVPPAVRHLSSSLQQAYHCFLFLLLYLPGCSSRQTTCSYQREEWVLQASEADYCQIELHILSHFSSDQSLLAAFHRVGFDKLIKAITVSWSDSRGRGRAEADSEVTDEECNWWPTRSG